MKRNPKIEDQSTIADLADKPGFLIRRAHQRNSAIFEAAAGAYGVTPVQQLVMIALFKHPGVDQVTLSSMVALDKVTVGQVLARLERRGTVYRTNSRLDRRSWALTLSPDGEVLLRKMQAAVRRMQAEVLAPLSPPQRKQFFVIMRRLVGMTPPYMGKSK